MSVLDRKLVRDIGLLRGQVVTICLVVAAGIAGYIAMQTAYRSLYASMDSYYEAYRFPDVFASARRVPEGVAEQLRTIPGVALVHTRIVERVRLPLEGGARAAAGSLVSLPDDGLPPLNGVHLREGRMPDVAHGDEALLLEEFAGVHGIRAGDRIPVVINGKLRQVLITGLAMSPEYVMALAGDVLSYGKGSFAVVWMRRSAVAPAFDMGGAFNDLLVRLQPGASEPAVIASVDRVLARYGGFGAYARDQQTSHRMLTEELNGLEVIVIYIPLIFLGVAAFLVNVVLGRVVELQRGQIATLKAIGYSNFAVGLHFLKLVCVIVLLGAALGIGSGAWLADGLLSMYEPYFRFPSLVARFDAGVLGFAVLISLLAALVGALISVRRTIALPPAEAMRPPAPARYRTASIDRWSRVVLGPLGQMVFRELRRRPLRTLISTSGIALAVAIMVIGRFASDSMDHLLDLHFNRAQKEDLSVTLREPSDGRAERALLAVPGVIHSEGIRTVPARLRFGSRSRETVLEGLPGNGRLRAVLNRDGHEVSLPLDGVVLTDVLAVRLGVKPGERINAELLEGDRRVESLLVSGTVSDMIGMQGYIRREALSRRLGEEPLVSTVLLSVEPDRLREAERRLYDMPAVGAVTSPDAAMKNFREQQAGTMLAMAVVLAFFASIIAVGIVYNNARVTLSMRGRDLASMRVLGFTRHEISTVLLGELAVHVLLALPLGMWLGTMGAKGLLSMAADIYRMPAVISSTTYVFAALVTIAAALVSGFLVRRKLDRLDLIGVLKTRE